MYIKNYRNWKINESIDDLDSALNDLYSVGLSKDEWIEELTNRFGYKPYNSDDPPKLQEFVENETEDNGYSIQFSWDPNMHGMHDITFYIDFNAGGEVTGIEMNSEHTSPDFELDDGVVMDDAEFEELQEEFRDNGEDRVDYDFYWKGEMPTNFKELDDILSSTRCQPYISLPSGNVSDYDIGEGWK